MFGIGWDILQPKGNIIAPIVFIPAKKKLLRTCPLFTVSQDATQSLPSLARENGLDGLR